jgi:hypothetical protein
LGEGGLGQVSQIFISYAKEDVDFARRLPGAFEGQGLPVCWDKQIPPGMDYAHVIEAAVLVFLGLGACFEALDWGDPEMFTTSALLPGLAVYLIFLGRKGS